MRRKTKIAIAILLAAVVLAATLHVYFIRDDDGGYVLWNDNEAFFFIGVSTRGLHVSWLGYPWFAFKNLLGGFAAVEFPDDERATVTVVRVTSAGSESHLIKLGDTEPGSGPSMYTPRGGRIYANYPTLGGLCVWSGDHFELATLDGRRGVDGISGLTNRVFENENGWSKQEFGDVPEVVVGNKFRISMRRPQSYERGVNSIDVLYPGRTWISVLHMVVRNDRVSGSEYRSVFYDRR